jgi:hypothetical protein
MRRQRGAAEAALFADVLAYVTETGFLPTYSADGIRLRSQCTCVTDGCQLEPRFARRLSSPAHPLRGPKRCNYPSRSSQRRELRFSAAARSSRTTAAEAVHALETPRRCMSLVRPLYESGDRASSSLSRRSTLLSAARRPAPARVRATRMFRTGVSEGPARSIAERRLTQRVRWQKASA